MSDERHFDPARRPAAGGGARPAPSGETPATQALEAAIAAAAEAQAEAAEHPDGADDGGDRLPAVTEHSSAEVGPALEHEPAPYESRFRVGLGILIGIALGAILAIVLVLGGRGPSGGGIGDTSWSQWRPSDSGDKGAQQIADHVAPSYKQENGDQLVAVTGGPLRVADLPVRIALSTGSQAQIVQGDSVLYTLCGLGQRCAIKSGKPSTARFLLLRREALELALYTFRYIDGVDNVVVLLPPRRGAKPENALFFQRDQFSSVLDTPLRVTLTTPPPVVAALRDSQAETTTIERLTDPSLFRYALQQGQDASAFLVLSPLTAAGK
jgi:hypothetical protein